MTGEMTSSPSTRSNASRFEPRTREAPPPGPVITAVGNGLPVAAGQIRSLRADASQNSQKNGPFRPGAGESRKRRRTAPARLPGRKLPQRHSSRTAGFSGISGQSGRRPKSNVFGRVSLNDVSCPPATGSRISEAKERATRPGGGPARRACKMQGPVVCLPRELRHGKTHLRNLRGVLQNASR